MSVSTIDRWSTLVAALLSSTCRFGGPSGDPTLAIGDGAGGVDTGNDGETSGSGGRAGGSGRGEGGGTGGAGPSTVDAAIDIGDEGFRPTDAALDASDDVPASEAGGYRDTVSVDAADWGSAEGGGPSDGATSCIPLFSSAVCDPVCNTGCPALFRCDLTDAPRTGVCIGSLLSTVGEGMACTRTPLTDDCIASLSCIDGSCQRLCYRDSDCVTPATCCNADIAVDAGPSGYRRCAPCTP